MEAAPNASLFTVGTYCDAIYSEDGRYFPCVIEKIEGDAYYVKFKKYNNKEIKSIYHLRESKNTDYSITNNFENMDTFKVPEFLKIQPSDTEE